MILGYDEAAAALVDVRYAMRQLEASARALDALERVEAVLVEAISNYTAACEARLRN